MVSTTIKIKHWTFYFAGSCINYQKFNYEVLYTPIFLGSQNFKRKLKKNYYRLNSNNLRLVHSLVKFAIFCLFWDTIVSHDGSCLDC